jgi:hypothetical protein
MDCGNPHRKARMKYVAVKQGNRWQLVAAQNAAILAGIFVVPKP